MGINVHRVACKACRCPTANLGEQCRDHVGPKAPEVSLQRVAVFLRHWSETPLALRGSKRGYRYGG